jgi:hypothetical protein
MSHLLDPRTLADDAAYAAALDELDTMLSTEPGAPGGHRLRELLVLIDDYEARRDGYDLARMRRLLAGSG